MEVLNIMLGGKSVVKLICMFSAAAAFALLGFIPTAHSAPQSHGAVYVLTNQPSQNAVMVFHRNADGSLVAGASFPTGGSGFGSGPNPLSSQGSLILSGDNRLLFAVNAGSNSISTFAVAGDTLTLVQTIDSAGTQPVSLTHYHDLVYVLNAGTSPNISGFRIVPEAHEGKILEPIAGSTQLLPTGSVAAPAEIAFTPDGSALLVTVPGANQIVSFPLGKEGKAAVGSTLSPTPSASATGISGTGPFGLAFSRSIAITANTDNGTPQGGGMSSYVVSPSGGLAPSSSAVPDNQTASTWAIVVEKGAEKGAIALTTNTMSGTISSYAVEPKSGSLTLTQPVAASLTAQDGSSLFPAGMALSTSGQFLYVRNGANGTVYGFVIQSSGMLTPITQASGLPETAAGIAAR